MVDFVFLVAERYVRMMLSEKLTFAFQKYSH